MKRKPHIRPTRLPGEAAQLAYKKGYFVEAIQILHAWFENQARELVMLLGSVYFKADLKNTWDLTDSFSFHDCLKILYIMNQISKNEYDRFNELNRLRNKIVHQMYGDPYDKDYPGIPKKEFDRVFKESLRDIWFFTQKSGAIVG